MKRKNIEAVPADGLNVLMDLPHVLPRMIDLIKGEWEPTPAQQEPLIVHLTECLYCQIVWKQLLEAILDSDKFPDVDQEYGRQLVAQLTEIIHTGSIRDNIGTYIETVDALGVDKANEAFPLLAEHLKVCKACRSEVDGTLRLLRQAQQEGCIAPP